jgi:hypothetical protein
MAIRLIDVHVFAPNSGYVRQQQRNEGNQEGTGGVERGHLWLRKTANASATLGSDTYLPSVSRA